jgi:hypothetical protein
MDQLEPIDLSLQLPRDTYYQVAQTLHALLPPPITNNPEDEARRDNAAIALVASLLPANADEANLAMQYALACAQAQECVRLSRLHPDDAVHVLHCTDKMTSMMRQARGFRSLLQRAQAARSKREKDGVALNSANWTEHGVIGLMADALGRTPPAPPAPVPVEPEAQPAEPEPDLAHDADQYAIHYPERARQIRAERGLPRNCRFGPPAEELLRAIVTGDSPILRALDTPATAIAAE